MTFLRDEPTVNPLPCTCLGKAIKISLKKDKLVFVEKYWMHLLVLDLKPQIFANGSRTFSSNVWPEHHTD